MFHQLSYLNYTGVSVEAKPVVDASSEGTKEPTTGWAVSHAGGEGD